MQRPTYTLLRSFSAPRTTLSRQRSFGTKPAFQLWNGTTQPVNNQQIPATLHPTPQQEANTKARAAKAAKAESATIDDSESIRRTHTKFIEDLLSRATSSDGNGFDKKPSRSNRRQRTKQHSLSEPQLFREDGPLTPYPIALDTGETLEPKHATLVRIFDKKGEQRSIVVAEVDDDTGKQRSILLSLDLAEYKDEKGAVGRRISAEEMYATLGLETQGGKS